MLSNSIKQRLLKAIDTFLVQLSCGSYSRQTIDGYRYDLMKFIELSERLQRKDRSIKQALNEQRLIDTVYLRYQDNPDITAFTVRRYVCAWRSWVKHLIDSNTLPPDFGRFRFELPKLPKILPKALHSQDLQTLLRQEEKNDWLGIRNRCIFELMGFSGLRIGEVINLRLTDLSLATRQIKVFGKGSVERIVPISEETAHHLRKYLLQSNKQIERKNNTLFVSQHGNILHQSTIRRALRQIAKSMGYEHITPHALRHSCATHFVRKTKDLRFVQLLLGHKSIATTQVYVHLDNEYISQTFDEHCLKSNS